MEHGQAPSPPASTGSPDATRGRCPECGASLTELAHLRQQVQELQQQVDSLNEQVHRDTLTNLFNYRHFSEALDRELARTQRSGQPTGLIMLDLDHFKRVNDRFGHETGNRVLVHLARLLTDTTRKPDIPCRYGGEEFAVILPSTDLSTSAQVAERLRCLIAEQPLQLDGENVHISASLGVDVYRARSDESQEAFVERVDQLLYQAKHSGRNRVCSGKPQLPATQISAAEKDALRGLFDDQS